MMWPSQNIFLHNGTIMQMIKRNKLVFQSPPHLAMHVPRRNYNNLISKKSKRFSYQQSIIINVRKKLIYCLPNDFL